MKPSDQIKLMGQALTVALLAFVASDSEAVAFLAVLAYAVLVSRRAPLSQ